MTVSTASPPFTPAEVHGVLARHILAAGYDIVFDFEKSHGAWLHDARAGRDPLSVDIQIVCPFVDLDDGASIEAARAVLDELAGYGANWAVVHTDGSSPTSAVDYITAFGETVIN